LLDETTRLTPSSIDYSESLDQIAVSHLNGTVKIYNASKYQLTYQSTFSNHGVLHELKWNPIDSHLVNSDILFYFLIIISF
jgi:WD40 repeat protein